MVAPVRFKAEWNVNNEHLKPPVRTPLQKIARVAWNILSVLIFPIGLARAACYGLGLLAKRLILPAATYPREIVNGARHEFNEYWYGNITAPYQQQLRHHFLAREHTIETPDGIPLAATHFRHADATPDTPTVICFQPNGTMKNFNTFLTLQIASITKGIPCNFIIFDYRGVGDSEGKFNGTDSLIRDGASIVQWAEKDLEVPKRQILFYGRSLGGAFSVLTQAIDPELNGDNVNERSLAGSKQIIDAYIGKHKRLSRFIQWVVRNQGYEFDPAASYHKLTGRKMVVYHTEDWIIPFAASMEAHARDVDHESIGLTALSAETTDHHNIPLHSYNVTRTGENALDRVSDFLFNPIR